MAEAHLTDFGEYMVFLLVFGCLCMFVGAMIAVAKVIWHN